MIFKEILGHPGYRLSDTGDVWGPSGKKLKLHTRPTGMLTVSIDSRSNPKTLFIHTAMCETFYGPRPSIHHSARHIDGDKSNNNLSNLEWSDIEPRVKLDESDVKEIREMLSRTPRPSLRYIAESFGVSRSCIAKIHSGEAWRGIT